MSAATMVSYRTVVMPWEGSAQDEERFARVLRRVLIVGALLCLAAWLLPLRAPVRSAAPELPPAMATMMLEAARPLPPPVAKAEILPKKLEADKEAAPVAHAHKEIASRQLPVPEARVPQPNKPAGEIDAARRKAAGVGLLALSSDLQQLSGAPMAPQLAPVKQGSGVGSGVGAGVGAGNEPGLPARAMITSNATGGSGGINTAGYSRNTGGGGLAGRATTVVAGVAGGGGGGGAGGGGTRGAGGLGVGAGNGAGGVLHPAGGGKMSRSIEDIRLVFERNKGAIYAIYNRALREEPGLQGRVVFKLTIAPSGAVTGCEIVSSELKSPELEAKLLARIRQFDFGAKSVEQMVTTYPFDFLPS